MRSAAESALVAAIEKAMQHWHERDLEGYFELYRSDAVLHHTHGDFDVAGAYTDYRQLFEAMPDAVVTFGDVVAEGELVAMRFTLDGTIDGVRTSRSGLSLLRFHDGRCVERWTSSH